jgi:hypothetical protein
VATVIKRRTTVRSAAAIRAAMAAFGIAEGDELGTTLAVSEDGETAALTSAKLPGTCACEDPVPVVFNLTTAMADYRQELDERVCEFLALAAAEQVREVARREGHAISSSEEVARGRKVIRLVVEQPPRKMTIDIDLAGREVNTSNQGFANPREGRAFARPYEALFGG